MTTHSRCITLGAAAIAVVLAFGLTTAHAQNKCLAGKTKCVNKRAAGLLKCQEKCQNNPLQCGAAQGICEGKVIAKSDGGTRGPTASCFEKLEAKNDGPCVTFGDLDIMGAKVDGFVGDVVMTLEDIPTLTPIPTPTVTPTETPRFVDNGDGTVTDRQTGLQWEQKTDDASVHDKDNLYTWGISGSPYPPNGTAFTAFLATLNGGVTGVGDCTSSDGVTQTGGFADHCDWRLPTIQELQTIVALDAPGCGGSPCIDPIFGPTQTSNYWSATTRDGAPQHALIRSFANGVMFWDEKTGIKYVRAVRGGSRMSTETVTPTPALTETPTPTPTSDRFVDNGDGTVTDNQMGLQWEKKTTAWHSGPDLTKPHDVDNVYSWNDYYGWHQLIADFLTALNTPPCLANKCDWRMPTVHRDGGAMELETILLPSCPGGTTPCIDESIFGPTAARIYWSATLVHNDPTLHTTYCVRFGDGTIGNTGNGNVAYVRAVRSLP